MAVSPPFGPALTMKTGRLASATCGSFRRLLNDFTVTEMSGTVRESTFFTAITISERLASFCLPGKVAFVISTLKLPLGSWASWRLPPQADMSSVARTVSAIPSRSRLPARSPCAPLASKAIATYHGVSGAETQFASGTRRFPVAHPQTIP